jgi:kynureninase
MHVSLERSEAQQRDREDRLASLRGEFLVPKRADGSDCIYLCGHSLGLQPRSAAGIVTEELERWAQLGVSGHFDSDRPWVTYHEQLSPGLARLAGAKALEVVAMNTLTVNLHLALASFYARRGNRYKILIERRAFSSDRYAVQSQVQLHGLDPAQAIVELAPLPGQATIRTDDVCAAIEREAQHLAVVLLPGVQFLTGQRFDMRTIAACARAHGSFVGFDLAHAIGNIPLELHEWEVDFAVWCGYKYLNGGPGAIGGFFLHERHAHAVGLPRLAGWWGHDGNTRFAMPDQFSPLPGAAGWQVSNPPILSSAPLIASLALFDATDFTLLRRKSVALTDYLEALLRARLSGRVDILTPSDSDARGCQLSLRLRANYPAQVFGQLNRAGYICDWRAPDIVRVAPVPMYNSFADVWEFVDALERQMQSS